MKPTKFGLTNNTVTFVDNFGHESLVYDGLDVSINAKLPNGGLVGGGTSTGRMTDNFCYALTDPSIAATNQGFSPAGGTFTGGAPRTQAFCDIRPPFQPNTKLYASYPVKWGIRASATFQSLPGPQVLASYTATNAEILPSLGRNLAAGARGTATTQLIAPATVYGDRLNQLDFRVSRIFNRNKGARLQAQVDLYNLLNGNPVIAQNNTFGPAWQRPTVVQLGRLVKFGMQIDF